MDRETEWLFSTAEGRKHLVKVTKYNRLAIVTLHRGQPYEGLQEVQNELNNNIKDFAPENLTEKVGGALFCFIDVIVFFFHKYAILLFTRCIFCFLDMSFVS